MNGKSVPESPKLYHIVHTDRLASIVKSKGLWSDLVCRQGAPGTSIGMSKIKERRLATPLTTYPDLCVGGCVPFYFCPRSVMLYLFYRNNHPEVSYVGGQEPIIHLVADMRAVIEYANQNNIRWVFTNSNAGSSYFNDYADLNELHKVDWDAVNAQNWSGKQEEKQAEFLVEGHVPWMLIESIGVHNSGMVSQVSQALGSSQHRPVVEVQNLWYY